MDAAEYKRLAELRVSGQTGTSFAEVLIVSGVIIAARFSNGIFRSLCGQKDILAIVEFLWLCGTMLLAVTCGASVAFVIVGLLVAVGSLIAVYPQLLPPPRTIEESTDGCSSHPRFFTEFRGSLMLLTCCAILAVDFPVFPLRHMKTETFGVSLMDTGVGCFVFAAAVSFGGKLSRGDAGFSRQWLGSSIPLLLLGASRAVIIWQTEYQEHVSEYGRHWNFFVTLGALPPLYVAINALYSSLLAPHGLAPIRRVLVRFPVLQGIAIGAAYQLALSLGVSSFLQSEDRGNVFAANKEGIFSCFGYMSIFHCGLQLGKYILAPQRSDDKSMRLTMVAVSAGLWALVALSETLIQPCSRRMCNLTYIIFTLALNTSFITCFLLISKIRSLHFRQVELLEAWNHNQLLLFLVANLSTGAINLSMRTIFASAAVSYIVVGGYLFVLCFLAVLLHRHRLDLRVFRGGTTRSKHVA